MAGAKVITLDHVAVMVSDLERSLRFYHDLLGFDFVASEEHDDRPNGGPVSTMTAFPVVQIREYRLRPAGGVNGHARIEGQGLTVDLIDIANDQPHHYAKADLAAGTHRIDQHELAVGQRFYICGCRNRSAVQGIGEAVERNLDGRTHAAA